MNLHENQPGENLHAPSPLVSEYQLRTAELFAPSAEIVEQYRPQLRDVIDKAMATTVGDHDKKVLALVGNVLDWQLFDPTGPLPKGLVTVTDSYERTYIGYDERLGIEPSCAMVAHSKLSSIGLGHIISAVQSDINTRESPIRQTLDKALRSTPEFSLIQSFNLKLPSPPTEQPLTVPKRFEREGQIARRAQARLGHDYARIVKEDPTTPESRKYNKTLQGVDQETMQRKATEEHSSRDEAKERAREYFLPLVKEQFERNFPGEPFGDFIRSGDNLLITMRDKDVQDTSVLAAETAASIKAKEMQAAGLQSDICARAVLLQRFLTEIYDPNSTKSYQQIVETTVSEASRVIFQYPRDQVGNGSYVSASYGLDQCRLIPSGDNVPFDIMYQNYTGHKFCPSYRPNTNPYRVDRATIEKARSQTQGDVLRADLGIPEGRIVQLHPFDKDIPSTNPKDELQISITSSSFGEKADPHIPGYRLSSRNGNIYGFVHDQAGDPYASPDSVELSDSQRAILSEQYARIGLNGLAQDVMNNPRLTVRELQGLIALRHSKVDEGDLAKDSHGPEYFTANTFDDFVRFVEAGKISMQCTASDRFLQLSLNALWPGCTSTIVGHRIGQNGQISKIGHVQTAFVYDGLLYILDATPVRDPPYFDLVDRSFGPPPRTQTSADIAQTIPDVHTDPADLISPSDLAGGYLQGSLNSIETQLGILFGIPDKEMLRERIAKLPEDDPIRMSLTVAILAARGMLRPGDVEGLIRYIELYSKADAELLRQRGLANYDPRIIKQLSTAIDQVHKYGAILYPDIVTTPPEKQDYQDNTYASGAIPPGSIAAVKQAIGELVSTLPSQVEVDTSLASIYATLETINDLIRHTGNPGLQGSAEAIYEATRQIVRGMENLGMGKEELEGYVRRIGG
ncbi:MAG TPA: hypothetical protein VMR45_05615 [Patescibacteria group bacterium]|nr:hypothetical protein [Patescibacteria group bacterium]